MLVHGLIGVLKLSIYLQLGHFASWMIAMIYDLTMMSSQLA